MKVYGYYRSSAAYRIRIALNLKGLEAEEISVNLATGEQHTPEFRQRNPQGLVPMLETEAGSINQSLAMLEWLDEQYPQAKLLPDEPFARAQVRALTYTIACDIHPLNNLRVLKYLVAELGADEDAKLRWYHHWLDKGFGAVEARLTESRFCCGEEVSLADVVLVPQVYNALRYEFPLSRFPNIERIVNNCNQLDAFDRARPERQEDCPESLREG